MSKESVRVAVRCRPFSKTEKEKGYMNVVTVDEERGMVSIRNPKPQKSSTDPVRDFTFDNTYGPNSKQERVFEQTALPILESVLEGYNGTIFAYGQTGTGKTFTMEGVDDPEEMKGIVPRTIDRIFKEIEGASINKQYLIRASFLELYNQQLIDLLAKPEKPKPNEKKKKLQIHERPNEGIKVSGLTEFMIESKGDLLKKYDIGKSHRVVAETQMNATSSRSHSIFSIIVQNQETIDGKTTTRLGKLNLVDLAGSERQSKTGVSGEQREQAININLSLTTLGLVIQNLVSPTATHIPYRDSNLTRLLQDSLGGNTKTVMIANLGPADYNYDETLSTLRYANRAKSIKNEVKINEDPKDALLRQFKNQIEELKRQLADGVGGVSGEMGVNYVQKVVTIEEGEDVQEIEEKFKKEQEQLQKQFDDQKATIYKNINMSEEEKNKLLKEIEAKEREQEQIRSNKEKLLKKLKQMEVKLISGHEEAEIARQKEEEFRRKQKELEDKIRQEERIQKELQEKESLIGVAKESYKNLKEESEDKTNRIKMLVAKCKKIQIENKELDEMYIVEIEELQERRRMLQKELKLKNLILEYFIPNSQLDSLQEKAFWSEERDEWMLPNLQYSGNSLRMSGQYKAPEPEKNEIQELTKQELENHPNMYFVYTEDGFSREMDLNPAEKKNLANKKSNKPGSAAKKRPGSKRRT